MEFTIPRLQELLLQPDANAGRQARLDNLICEERVCTARQATYEAFLNGVLRPDSAFYGNADSWAALHERYFQQRVASPDSVTFSESNDWTARPTIAEEDWIIRLERVDGAFSGWEIGASSSKTAIDWLSEWAETLNASPVASPARSASSLPI